MNLCVQGMMDFGAPPSTSEVSTQRRLLCDRPPVEPDEIHWRSPKVGRRETVKGEQMLSFSSCVNKENLLMVGNEGKYLFHSDQDSDFSSPHPCLSNGELYCGNANMNIHEILTNVRGPFTPSQWMELQHQAFIFKYIVANSPIPANLLIPIRRSFSTSRINPYSAGSLIKWGTFQLGHSRNTDLEAGRCRRTDGKKWRCSRDAEADQKYCERHLNRGRHRSRKHVEGLNVQATKEMPVIISSQSTNAVFSDRSSASLKVAKEYDRNMLLNVNSPCNAEFKRMSMNNKDDENSRDPDLESLSFLTFVNPKPTSTLFPISKGKNPFESTPTASDFRFTPDDPDFNDPASSFSDDINFVADRKPTESQSEPHMLRHFFDEWPKSQSELPNRTWSDIKERHSDRTQLSISIPVASYDLSSSTCSPNTENHTTLSPLHTSLGFSRASEATPQKGSWTPDFSWKASVAGPLGEVLTNTTITSRDQNTNCLTSPLNVLADGWDSSSHPELSPTGVLQEFTFGSLSSSTLSSPRVLYDPSLESIGSLSDDPLGSIYVCSTNMRSC